MAERVMSVLNLALQNVATERDKMDVNHEEIVKRNKSMTKLREAGARVPAFKDAFKKSMAPVKMC